VLHGIDGDARWAVDANNIAITSAPSGTLYFQPDGRITSDGAGATAINATITVAGETALTLTGETGHVR
jgi:MSHA pilin protein MshC